MPWGDLDDNHRGSGIRNDAFLDAVLLADGVFLVARPARTRSIVGHTTR